MIIIEMASDSKAFHTLLSGALRTSHTFRVALDEGEFKIKVNEDVWTPELEDVILKVQGGTADLLRDLGINPKTGLGLTKAQAAHKLAGDTAYAVEHEIDIDEQVGGPTEPDDVAYKAFCSCGWQEDHWHHTDSEEAPLTAADEAGADHLEEVAR